MYRFVSAALLLAISCGEGAESDESPPRQTRAVKPTAPAVDTGAARLPNPKCTPSPHAADTLRGLAKAAKTAGTLGRLRQIRPCTLTRKQRLTRELLVHRIENAQQRAAVRRVKTGRPLARTRGGKTAYEAFVRIHATTRLSIAELRSLIYAELTSAEKAIEDMLAVMPTKPKRRQVIDARAHADIARAAQRRGRAAARLAFDKTPSATSITIIRSARSPLAFYSRRGVYLNLHATNRPPAHLVEAIVFHETIPGHHLENELNTDGRKTREHSDSTYYAFNGFVEGWGLYAEELAADLDLYSNAVSRLGRHELRAWRAARAAVDIGLHYDGWTIEHARKFMTDHTVLSSTTIRVELNRVLNRPGRVQAYVVGAKALRDLRRRAYRDLGPLFSLAAFHEVVLGHGRVPLTSLARLVTEWIQRVHAHHRA